MALLQRGLPAGLELGRAVLAHSLLVVPVHRGAGLTPWPCGSWYGANFQIRVRSVQDPKATPRP